MVIIPQPTIMMSMVIRPWLQLDKACGACATVAWHNWQQECQVLGFTCNVPTNGREFEKQNRPWKEELVTQAKS
jgi:hypothetical protein